MEKGQIKKKKFRLSTTFGYLWYTVVLSLILKFCVGIIYKSTVLFGKLCYWDDTTAKFFTQTHINWVRSGTTMNPICQKNSHSSIKESHTP